jgi:hypothetical protein
MCSPGSPDPGIPQRAGARPHCDPQADFDLCFALILRESQPVVPEQLNPTLLPNFTARPQKELDTNKA